MGGKNEVPQSSMLTSRHAHHIIPESKSQHTWNPHRIAIRVGVLSAANTMTHVVPAGLLANTR